VPGVWAPHDTPTASLERNLTPDPQRDTIDPMEKPFHCTVRVIGTSPAAVANELYWIANEVRTGGREGFTSDEQVYANFTIIEIGVDV
jgi:hypothetical protein